MTVLLAIAAIAALRLSYRLHRRRGARRELSRLARLHTYGQ